jgi:hypothetical protein
MRFVLCTLSDVKGKCLWRNCVPGTEWVWSISDEWLFWQLKMQNHRDSVARKSCLETEKSGARCIF